jgi:hypothetical protein
MLLSVNALFELVFKTLYVFVQSSFQSLANVRTNLASYGISLKGYIVISNLTPFAPTLLFPSIISILLVVIPSNMNLLGRSVLIAAPTHLSIGFLNSSPVSNPKFKIGFVLCGLVMGEMIASMT